MKQLKERAWYLKLGLLSSFAQLAILYLVLSGFSYYQYKHFGLAGHYPWYYLVAVTVVVAINFFKRRV